MSDGGDAIRVGKICTEVLIVRLSFFSSHDYDSEHFIDIFPIDPGMAYSLLSSPSSIVLHLIIGGGVALDGSLPDRTGDADVGTRRLQDSYFFFGASRRSKLYICSSIPLSTSVVSYLTSAKLQFSSMRMWMHPRHRD